MISLLDNLSVFLELYPGVGWYLCCFADWQLSNVVYCACPSCCFDWLADEGDLREQLPHPALDRLDTPYNLMQPASPNEPSETLAKLARTQLSARALSLRR